MTQVIHIVTEDLGDGDVALRYFSTGVLARAYMDQNDEWCYYESNPRSITVADVGPAFRFDDAEVKGG